MKNGIDRQKIQIVKTKRSKMIKCRDYINYNSNR